MKKYLCKKHLLMKCIFLFLTILLVLLSGCDARSKTPTSDDTDKLTVYTSIYPVYDFTQKIGGDKIKVINIVPAGSQPHSFEPSTQTVAKLSKAKLFIYNGAGMEHYLPKLSQTLANTGVKLVNTSQLIHLIPTDGHQDAEEGHGDEEDEHNHGEYDPHIWLSPTRAIEQGQAIYQALAEIDPDNQAYYEANFTKFRLELEDLDSDFRETLSQCPSKDIIVSHAAFTYLTEDYGLNQVSLMGINADAEPGPATLKNTVDYIKENNIPYVFWDPLDNPKLLQTLSQETGAEILSLNSLGALGEKEIDAGEDYLSIMRTNLENLQKGLGYPR